MTKTKAQSTLKFSLILRIMHWLMATLIIAMLIIGASMMGFIEEYATLKPLHEVIGLIVLILAIIRIAYRLSHREPQLDETITPNELILARISEFTLYALFSLQPIIGWALLSSSGISMKIGGVLPLPPIVPENLSLYGFLHQVHTILAFALLLALTMHIIAIVFHVLVIQDNLLARMTINFKPKTDSHESSHPSIH